MDKPPPENLNVYSFPSPKRLEHGRQNSQNPKSDDDNNGADDPLAQEPHEDIPVRDGGFSVFLKALIGIIATLVTAGIVGITTISVSTARKVDVLVDRPQSVPMDQYQRDMQQLKENATETRTRVDRIEQRQLEGIAKGR